MREGQTEEIPGEEPRRSKSIAVSGTTGFIGGVLLAELRGRGFEVREISRADLEVMRDGAFAASRLEGCACAIHLAARAHVLHETDEDPLLAFREINRDLTLAFAQACAAAGVKRFVFVSSIGVNGSSSVRPFRAADPPCPDEPYAISKLEAENGLREIARVSNLDFVIVRPPLVYGPGARGNFGRLMKLARLPIPLPLGRVSAMRSYISVWNLSDLLIRCAEHPAARGRIFLASDATDISLPELLTQLRSHLGRRGALLPVPNSLLRLATGLVGKRHVYEKLTASLLVDTEETRRVLGWTPPLSLHDGLAATVRIDTESRGSPPASGRRSEGGDLAKRFVDIGIASLAFVAFAVPMLVIGAVVAATSRGPVLYWSDRIGRNNVVFRMPKFRSMYVGTPPVATHLLADPSSHITPVGQFLRTSSLDELPQLWSVLVGDMSLVGPRPALFNQHDLIEARTAAGVHVLRPGITGWAQVNGRDELPIPAKVAFDAQYLARRSLLFDARILVLTALRVVKRDGVSH